jgi:hypothetical protein
MITDLKSFKAFTIVVIILFSSVTISVINPDSKVVDTASAALINFNSYADLQYDASALQKPLAIDVSVTIPITVEYWTDIPAFFGTVIPYPLNFYILFGQPIGPMQKIHLEVLNPPSWANIYISSPDLLTDIPFYGDDHMFVKTNLIVSPRIEAPAESYKIDIKATGEPIGKVRGFTYQESIDFTPSFVPTVQVTTKDPIRTVSPHESVNFQINVRNLGNKITRVTPTIKNKNPDWTETINPPELEIDPNDEATFTFSIIAPYDFGWHNEYESFEVQFKSEVYPYRTGAANNTKSVYLVVNNYGFSTPGFELLTFVVAALAIALIIRRKKS